MPPIHFSDEIVHKALASQVRRDILLSIADKEKYLSEIAEEINRKPQTIDFHLSLLEEIGLVIGQLRDGKRYYSLKDKKIIEFLKSGRPLPNELHPKAPHEIVLDMWEDIKKRLDHIEKRFDDLDKK